MDASRDAEFMGRLVEFTMTSAETEHPSPFGCSIVHSTTGEVVVQAYDTVMKSLDPTAHGEVNAIRQACAALRTISLKGYTLYSTCEPCPMCMSASVWSEVDAVVFGATFSDAHKYWPQPSSLGAIEVGSRMVRTPQVIVRAEVLREACVAVFDACEAARVGRQLELPPHRD
jgi:tRNA(Arg) A34 adenosine deaminase TadA